MEHGGSRPSYRDSSAVQTLVAPNGHVGMANIEARQKYRKARNLIDQVPRYDMERETGLEPAAFCLGSRSSTTELLPRRASNCTTGFEACQCEVLPFYGRCGGRSPAQKIPTQPGNTRWYYRRSHKRPMFYRLISYTAAC